MLTSNMFATPMKPFVLSLYAPGLAQVFAEESSPVSTCNGRYNRQ